MTTIHVVSLRLCLPGVVLLLFSLQLLFAAVAERKHLRQDLIERSFDVVRQDMAQLQWDLEHAFSGGPRQHAEKKLTLLGIKPEVRTLAALDAEARVIFATRFAWKGRSAVDIIPGFEPERFQEVLNERRASTTLDEDGQSIIAYYPLALPRQVDELRSTQLGGIFLHYDLSAALNAIWWRVVSHSSVLWFGSLAILSGLLFALYSLVTRPVRKLAETARHLAAGAQGVQVRIKGHGELAELGKAFNEMSSEIDRTMDALRESDERWQFALEGSRDGVWDWNAKTNRVFYSKRWKKMLGYEEHEISDHLDEWDQRIHPSDRERVYADLEKHLRGETLYFHNEHRVRCKDGSYKWILDRGKVIEHDEKNEPIRIIGTHTDITARKEVEAQIEQLAYFDELTGLPNRRCLLERVDQALSSAKRHGHHGALLFLDLDNFKHINDSLGHPAGDALLKQVAQRLIAHTRTEDIVGRLGGDEFVVLATMLSDDGEHAVRESGVVAEKLRAALDVLYVLDGQSYHVTPSIGVAVFPEEHGTADDLLKHADTAMYQSKQAGRNAVRHFQSNMQAEADSRLALEQDLGLALDGELSVYLQPQINIRTGKIIGAEALLRWNHPQKGMITPADFMPIAEETGLICPIGEWVMLHTVEHIRAWLADGLLSDAERIAVNVSPRQFNQPDFVEKIIRTLEKLDVSPTYLKLEITEKMLMTEESHAIEKMIALRKLGVCLCLDDFGTGYSSLFNLKRLPIDQLKIDCSFVRDIPADPCSSTIANTIIAMARHLGLEVIAECVQTRTQLDFLKQQGCGLYQGTYFSPPVPVEEFDQLLKKNHSDRFRSAL